MAGLSYGNGGADVNDQPAENPRVMTWLDTLSPEDRLRASFYLSMPPEMALARIGVQVESGMKRLDDHLRNHPSMSAKQMVAIFTGVGTLCGAALSAAQDILTSK